MFSFFEFLHPGWMTPGAGLGSGDYSRCCIYGRIVLVTVAGRAIYIILAVFAGLPIRNNVRGNLFVAINALLGRWHACKQKIYRKDKNKL
jgi:hypothetical protein